MSTLFIYMLKVAVYLAAFYLVYSLFLSRDTSYSRNRAFILLSFFLALLLPLISFQTIKPMGIQFFGKLLSEVLITASRNGSEKMASGSLAAASLNLIFSVYIIGVSVFIVKLIADFGNLIYLIFRKKSSGSRIIRFHGFNTAGFSAMGYVFINTRLSPEEAGEIIRHEQNHLKRNHFIDVIFIELIKAFQWFNPVVYLFDRSLRAIHEYQADEGCLSSGIPMVNYQCLLLNQVFKSRAFNLTNSFSNPSLVKKRMIMMTKKRTSSIASVKLLFMIPVTAIVFLAISAYKETPAASDNSVQTTRLNESDPYVAVEEMPHFPGGDSELLKFIASNTNYPETAKQNNIQGKVIVRFCVTAEGGISLASILKGVDPELDAEALRVVLTLPNFNPGRQGGKAVPVWYMVPINFALK